MHNKQFSHSKLHLLLAVTCLGGSGKARGGWQALRGSGTDSGEGWEDGGRGRHGVPHDPRVLLVCVHDSSPPRWPGALTAAEG